MPLWAKERDKEKNAQGGGGEHSVKKLISEDILSARHYAWCMVSESCHREILGPAVTTDECVMTRAL